MKVMITGAGGSIGSALARHLKGHELVLYEVGEFNLYQISEDLPDAVAVLGDVRDRHRFQKFARGCEVVFHCAAYKHVPLLEGINAEMAWSNNVEGTRSVIEGSKNARAVVLLSTDKAINPLGVMGQSKRMAECITRAAGRTVARLGNILESSGSVVPKFRRQIEAGGPVTVTHPEATRYFIPMDKAVSFLADCAEREPGTYMVPMGEPVRILDLARQMIGDRDINIEFTGLRPGEKLHEELEDA